MQTVFSHVIQKRFSQAYEDVATDALAFILRSSDAAQRGMMRLLRGIVPGLPATLHFRTQQTEGSIRPDMWGYSEDGPRVFVENKFWAGLTDNQPVAYVRQLARYQQPTALLIVAPAAREHTLRREVLRRLADSGISVSDASAAGDFLAIPTDVGPLLALISWRSLLAALEQEAVDDPPARADIAQLRALCDAADVDAFAPLSDLQISDQRTPAFMLQLGALLQASADLAFAESVLSSSGTRAVADWESFGRYAWVGAERGAGIWLGVHLRLWKVHGGGPLWLRFPNSDFGRANEVGPLLAPWAARNDVLVVAGEQEVAICLDLKAGEEKDVVVRSVVDRLKEIAAVLAALPPRAVSSSSGEPDLAVSP